MRLSEISAAAGISVERDGEFQNLGFLPDRYPEMLAFLENERFAAALGRNESVAAVLTTPELAGLVPQRMALALSGTPRLAFAEIHSVLALDGFYWKNFPTAIDPRAQIHPTAWVAERNVRIGPGSSVGPQAAVLERAVIEEGVTIGAGAVIGGVGFQTVRSDGAMVEMRHAGGVTIRDRAHVLPGAVIATGLFRHGTEIKPEARVGSRAFVSHAVRIGMRSFVGHGAVVNGNVIVGDDAWIGPGAVVANNLTIGEHAIVSLGAVVVRDVAPGARMSGNFAVKHGRLMRLMVEMEARDPSV